MSVFKWHGTEILNAISEELDRALMTCAADLQNKSANRAPIDTGKLRESCVIDDSEENTVKVGYSPEVDDYSVVQHEHLEFKHPRGGEAKYLENPFNENAQRYIDAIGEAIGGTIK